MRVVDLPALSSRTGKRCAALVESYPPELVPTKVPNLEAALQVHWPPTWVALTAPKAVDRDLPDADERTKAWDLWYDAFLAQCLKWTPNEVRNRLDPKERHTLIDAIFEVWGWEPMSADDFVGGVAHLAKSTGQPPSVVADQPLPKVVFDLTVLARAVEVKRDGGIGS